MADRRELIESALEASENGELETPVDAPAELPVENEISTEDQPRNEKGQFTAKEEAPVTIVPSITCSLGNEPPGPFKLIVPVSTAVIVS